MGSGRFLAAPGASVCDAAPGVAVLCAARQKKQGFVWREAESKPSSEGSECVHLVGSMVPVLSRCNVQGLPAVTRVGRACEVYQGLVKMVLPFPCRAGVLVQMSSRLPLPRSSLQDLHRLVY